jgi:hypothetical protein
MQHLFITLEQPQKVGVGTVHSVIHWGKNSTLWIKGVVIVADIKSVARKVR